MKLSSFNYDLPIELLAEYPSDQRDESRLMVLHRDSGKIEHKTFKDVIDYFVDGDSFVLNNTKVFPARLIGNKEKTGARIEVFLLRELSTEQRLWDVLVDPARKIRIGNKLYFGDDDSLVAEVIDNTTSRGRTLRFLFDGLYEEFKEKLKSSWIGVDAWGGGDCCARLWEILSNETMAVCQKYQIEFPNDFTDGENIVYYSTINEFEYKVRNYLNNREEIERISNNGYRHLLGYHTAEARVKYIMDKINENIRN